MIPIFRSVKLIFNKIRLFYHRGLFKEVLLVKVKMKYFVVSKNRFPDKLPTRRCPGTAIPKLVFRMKMTAKVRKIIKYRKKWD